MPKETVAHVPKDPVPAVSKETRAYVSKETVTDLGKIIFHYEETEE